MTDGQQQPPQFQYPQILLDVSLESLLSHSKSSTMTTSAPETYLEPENLLSESWATLSNSDYSREDDLRSETTDVGSLVSNNGTEDVHSIDDDSESEDDEGQPMSNQVYGSSQGSDPLAQPLAPISTSSAREGIAMQEQDDLSALEFKEPRDDGWPEAGQVDVKHTMRIFDEAEAHQILGPSEPSTHPVQIVGTVRMSMSRSSLDLDRPFRVFYVGETTARDDILLKIAGALLAGVDPKAGYRDVESSRYHVLPHHYGPGAPSGGADLVPIQKTQIIVDEIRSACYKDEHQSEIKISLKNGLHYFSKRKGSNYEISSTTPSFVPDVALFYTSEDDSPVLRQILHCAHNFMLRHHVPSMIVSGEASWTSPFNTLPLKLQSLHMCVESKASENQDGRVLRRIPVDFSTLEKLDPKQLNKNLACLVDPALLNTPAIIPRTACIAKFKEASAPAPGDIEKNLGKNTMMGGSPLYGYSALLQQVLLGALSLVVFGLCYAAFQPGIGMVSSYIDGRGDLVAPTAILMPATSSVGLVPSSVALTSMPVTTVECSVYKSLATVAHSDLSSSISLSHNEMVVNESDRFQVQVIGDCHMIIKAPAKLKVKRRDPGFKISVARGSELLDDLTLSKLFDGVYTVQINRDDAYGPLNVTITMSKAGIIEVHEVDFGTPWLKAAGWKKAASKAQEDIGTAQEAAFALAKHLTVDLETRLQAFSNFTSSLGRLYQDAGRRTEALSTNTQAYARSTSERVRVMSEQLRRTSAKQHVVASKMWADNIELVQNSVAESSGAIAGHVHLLREVSVKAIAKAQARAKQIAREWRQRKNLRKTAKEAARSRCGRKGKKCNR